MYIEPLEARIAPAALAIASDQRTVTWTDVDGDLVTLKITKGTLEEGDFVFEDSGAGLVVKSLDITADEFADASLTISAKRVVEPDNAVGNGQVDVGYINAAGHALKKVKVAGDLGRIDVGLDTLTNKRSQALASLTVGSLGTRPDILDGVPSDSEINGRVGSLLIAGELRGSVHVTGEARGSIGTLVIGSVIGGDLAGSGRIDVTGSVDTIRIASNVHGGEGQRSGSIDVGGSIGSLTIGGAVVGGRGEDQTTDGTGVIRAGTAIGTVTVKGSIHGGTQQESGLIEAGGRINKATILGSIYGGTAGQDNGGIRAGEFVSLTIKGDVRGGEALNSGFVESAKVGTLSLSNLVGGNANGSGVLTLGTAAKITISGDIVGGSIGALAVEDVVNSGTITASQIKSLTVGGSIRVGEDSSAGFDLINTAAVRVSNNLLNIVVNGALVGTEETHVLITARGEAIPVFNSGKDVAINKASFGSVAYADILAGYNAGNDVSTAAVNPNAQIGKVNVAGGWTASSLVAGAAYKTVFGAGTDVKSGGVDDPNVTARIASIVIKGAIAGTETAGDHYGFVAQAIGKLKFGKSTSVLLSPNASDDNDPASLRYNLANTLDVRVFEFAG